MANWDCIKDIRKVGDIMYRVCENGIYRDATQEEIEELEKMQQESQNRTQELTLEDKIQANTEELERQAQAIEDLIMMTLGGE